MEEGIGIFMIATSSLIRGVSGDAGQGKSRQFETLRALPIKVEISTRAYNHHFELRGYIHGTWTMSRLEGYISIHLGRYLLECSVVSMEPRVEEHTYICGVWSIVRIK